MRKAEREAPPLVVLRSETESGRVALRLAGELDLHTVHLLEAALASSRGQPPPSVIDLSELTFMDLVGLRTLLRAVEGETAGLARLVGATGIVRRLLELAQTIGSAPEATAQSPAPGESTTTLTAVAAAWQAQPAASTKAARAKALRTADSQPGSS
jgi:anti-anti-sigma factor